MQLTALQVWSGEETRRKAEKFTNTSKHAGSRALEDGCDELLAWLHSAPPESIFCCPKKNTTPGSGLTCHDDTWWPWVSCWLGRVALGVDMCLAWLAWWMFSKRSEALLLPCDDILILWDSQISQYWSRMMMKRYRADFKTWRRLGESLRAPSDYIWNNKILHILHGSLQVLVSCTGGPSTCRSYVVLYCCSIYMYITHLHLDFMVAYHDPIAGCYEL